MKRIGIDIGTTTVSAVVLDDAGREVLEAKTVPNGCFLETGHAWERIQDAEAIVRKAKLLVDELLERHPDAGAVGLTGQMHGILYLDAQGTCVSPLYTWQDQRGNLEEFGGESLVDMIKRTCGEKAAAGYGLVTHTYLCKKGLLPPGAASLCTVPDYLGMVLTGRVRPLLHISMAASLGFFDRQAGRFCEDELGRLGADVSVLPEVTDRFSVLGGYRGRPVTVAIGDNQASFLGSVGFETGVVLLNVGTGGQISVLSESFFETEGIEARPLTRDRFLLVGSSLCGGRAYAILEKFFRSYMEAAGADGGSQYGVMEKLALAGERTGEALQVETTFHGTRADPNRRGSIRGISEDNFTPQAMVLGVLGGLARELYDLFALIREGTGIEARSLVGSGNGVRRNEVLRRIFESMFQARLTLSKYEEEAACGAALCGMYEGPHGL